MPNLDTLIVHESVVGRLDAAVVYERAGVGSQAADGSADVVVQLEDLLDAALLQQSGRAALLHAKHNTFVRSDADRAGAKLNSTRTRQERAMQTMSAGAA